MSNAFLKTIPPLLISLCVIFVLHQPIRAQTSCLYKDDVKKMLARIESGESPAVNGKLGKELARMKEKFHEKYRYAADADFQLKGLNDDLAKTRTRNDARFCAILREFGWPTIRLAGDDGAEAALYLLQNSVSPQFQADLLPVVSAAVRKGLIEKDDEYATFIDRLRLRAGMKQIFGTQTVRLGDFLVLQPLLSDRKVDAWRREYHMSPLAEYIKKLEIRYRTPVLGWRGGDTFRDGDAEAGVALSLPDEKKEDGPVNPVPGGHDEKDDVVRVDTTLVSLPVFVYDASNNPMNVLTQKDFEVYEDGRKEDISYFSAADSPFDLVLLIDLSGSTTKMVDLIKNATTRFIETKRPGDRLAIVTFADNNTVVSPLTDDREKLLASVQTMAERGNSRVWDALKFSLESMFTDKSPQKRRAVVFLTDGVDNSLLGQERGSKISFNELFETVKRNEITIFPIYLDTESQSSEADAYAYKNARSTLALLALETGGRSYKAEKIEDISGVYAEVRIDLSRVYTIGYTPTNDKRDGAWRSIRVEVPGRTEISIKTKSGYYAK